MKIFNLGQYQSEYIFDQSVTKIFIIIIVIITNSNPRIIIITWCHRTPADTPTRPCNCHLVVTAISNEQELDDVGSAYDVSWQGVAAAFLHQRCPVAVRDCQVVVVTGVMVFDVESSEFQRKDQSLLDLNRLCLL